MEDSYTLNIKSIPKNDRPRERLMTKGASALSDTELVAIIIGKGTKKYPLQVLSQKLLTKFSGLKGLLRANLNDLMQVDGVGLAKACQLAVCFEISLRNIQRSENVYEKAVYKRSDELYELLRPYILGKDKEILLIVSLDTKNRLIAVDTSTIGTINQTLYHPREIFRPAILRNAARVVLAHNHPSEDPTPSDQDIELTKRIVDISYKIGIPVIDHIILCSGNYLSLADEGYLEKEMVQ